MGGNGGNGGKYRQHHYSDLFALVVEHFVILEDGCAYCVPQAPQGKGN